MQPTRESVLTQRVSRVSSLDVLSMASMEPLRMMERTTSQPLTADADALAGMARAGAGEVTTTACEQNPHQEQDVFSAPVFTDEEEWREKQQVLSPIEILDIESDLRGITAGINAMSIAGGNGSSGVGAYRPEEGHCRLGRNGDQYQEQPSSWRKPDEIQRDLNLLTEEMERIPLGDKTAYQTAMQRCPAEAFGGWRWDAFLEQRDFDAKRTAKNLVEYWKMRLALFGEDRCYLPMTLAGAMQDEVAGMMTYDPHRISPVKDTAGRTVMVITPSRRLRSLYSTKSASRAFWYELEVIAQDPEARRCGIVIIFNGININPSHFDPRFGKFASSSFDLFPVPQRAIHLANVNTFVSRIIVPALRFLFGKRMRHRFVVHTGTISNTIEEMRTYALPTDRLPKEFGGEVVVDMQAWIYGRYAKEGLNIEDPGLETHVEPNVEPSIKRMRSEVSADLLPDVSGGSGNVASVLSSPDQPSHTQQPGDRIEPAWFPSSPMLNVQIEITQEKPGKAGRKADPRLNIQETSTAPIPLASATDEKEGSASSSKGRAKGKARVKIGKKSDPRMSRAIEIKQANPDLPLYDALVAGGFVFSDDGLDDLVDADGITLKQRKNNLCRRLRLEKQKRAKQGVANSTNAKQMAEGQHEMPNPKLVSPPMESAHKSSPLQVQSFGEGGAAVAQQSVLPLEGDDATKCGTNNSMDHNIGMNVANLNGSERRDSFYEDILKLPGLDGIDDIDYIDEALSDDDHV